MLKSHLFTCQEPYPFREMNFNNVIIKIIIWEILAPQQQPKLCDWNGSYGLTFFLVSLVTFVKTLAKEDFKVENYFEKPRIQFLTIGLYACIHHFFNSLWMSSDKGLLSTGQLFCANLIVIWHNNSVQIDCVRVFFHSLDIKKIVFVALSLFQSWTLWGN